MVRGTRTVSATVFILLIYDCIKELMLCCFKERDVQTTATLKKKGRYWVRGF